jgi:hypothetical protein
MVRESGYPKFDDDFKQGAVRLVFETGKPIAQIAQASQPRVRAAPSYNKQSRRPAADMEASSDSNTDTNPTGPGQREHPSITSDQASANTNGPTRHFAVFDPQAT